MLFEQAAQEHAGLVARIVSTYEHDRHLVDDLVQEVFLAFWRALPSFRGDAKVTTFLARIAHNVCISHVRRAVRQPSGDAEALDLTADRLEAGPDHQTVQWEQRQRLLAAIRKLPLPTRQVVTLHLEGFSGRDIAEALDISENNAAVRLTRARAALRDALGGSR
jgi:RNA polymerase sigma factor (sigma-70 family)